MTEINGTNEKKNKTEKDLKRVFFKIQMKKMFSIE